MLEKHPVLYVHPKTSTVLKEIIPMAMPALINRIEVPVLGKFQSEVTDQDLRACSVLIMDVHWYLSVPTSTRFAAYAKSINPDLKIVVGGVSATYFAKQLVATTAIDYVIRGDADDVLWRAVDAILNQKSLEDLPNIWSRDFHSNSRYTIQPSDLDTGNFRNIDFFPTLQKRVHRLHKHSNGHPYSTYPYVYSFRGCPMPCDSCVGSALHQRRAFGRRWVARSPERVREDLEQWSKDPRLKYTAIFHDFVNMLPLEYTESVLNQQYDLRLFLDLFRLPGEESLRLILESFQGGILLFSLDELHSTSDKLCDVEELIHRILMVKDKKGFSPSLSYVKKFYQPGSEYARALDKVRKVTNVRLNNAQYWWEHNPLPDAEGFASDDDFLKCFKDRDKRFLVMNATFKTGVVVNRFAPKLARKVADTFFAQ